MGWRISLKKEREAMICRNCGRILNDDSRFCPICGTDLQTQAVERAGNGHGMKKRKHIPRSGISIVVLIVAVIFVILISGGSTDKGETIERLLGSTDATNAGDSFIFTYGDTVVGDPLKGWELTYTSENEFVRFSEDTVASCFVYWFGADCLKRPGFSYDLDENAARVYFDVEIDEGDLSIINYDIDSDEFTLMIDGERYEASDELIRFMDSYDIPQIFVDDIKSFKEDLSDNGISFDGITDLRYEDISKYIEDRSAY